MGSSHFFIQKLNENEFFQPNTFSIYTSKYLEKACVFSFHSAPAFFLAREKTFTQEIFFLNFSTTTLHHQVQIW